MGEAKRRKSLDPNYGKTDFDNLLINSNNLIKGSKITRGILVGFAALFVPKDILRDFWDFQYRIENEEIPKYISDQYPSDAAGSVMRSFMELDLHDETIQWIDNFLDKLAASEDLSQWQLANATKNIRKGIILHCLQAPCLYEMDYKDPFDPNPDEYDEYYEERLCETKKQAYSKLVVG